MGVKQSRCTCTAAEGVQRERSKRGKGRKVLRNRNAVNRGARWGLRCGKGGDGAPGGSGSEAGMRAAGWCSVPEGHGREIRRRVMTAPSRSRGWDGLVGSFKVLMLRRSRGRSAGNDD